ncbi:hypothetical protein LAY57_19995 [Argonema antarcticum A004/B2]|nr:hypothetical protein [Argonema antarcticum A004/B2]
MYSSEARSFGMIPYFRLDESLTNYLAELLEEMNDLFLYLLLRFIG